jgi:hypothetical protein
MKTVTQSTSDFGKDMNLIRDIHFISDLNRVIDQIYPHDIEYIKAYRTLSTIKGDMKRSERIFRHYVHAVSQNREILDQIKDLKESDDNKWLALIKLEKVYTIIEEYEGQTQIHQTLIQTFYNDIVSALMSYILNVDPVKAKFDKEDRDQDGNIIYY